MDNPYQFRADYSHPSAPYYYEVPSEDSQLYSPASSSSWGSTDTFGSTSSESMTSMPAAQPPWVAEQHEKSSQNTAETPFARAVREQDELFFATFPDARRTVPQPQWVLDQFSGDVFQGSGFYYDDNVTGYTSTPKVALAESPATVTYPSSTEAMLISEPVTLHYDYVTESPAHFLDASPSSASFRPDPRRQHSRANPNDGLSVSSDLSSLGTVQNESRRHSEIPPPSLVDTSDEAVHTDLVVPSQQPLVELYGRQRPLHGLRISSPYMDHLPPPPSPSEEESPSSPYSSNSPTSADFFQRRDSASVPPPDMTWSSLVKDLSQRVLAPAPPSSSSSTEAPLPSPQEASSSLLPRRQHNLHKHLFHQNPSLVELTARQSGKHGSRNNIDRLLLRTIPPILPPRTGTRSTSVQKRTSIDKKPPLACLFCRGRKIACGPPLPGTTDKTCNQCQRRSLPCEYPAESRRGMRKKRPVVLFEGEVPIAPATSAVPGSSGGGSSEKISDCASEAPEEEEPSSSRSQLEEDNPS